MGRGPRLKVDPEVRKATDRLVGLLSSGALETRRTAAAALVKTADPYFSFSVSVLLSRILRAKRQTTVDRLTLAVGLLCPRAIKHLCLTMALAVFPDDRLRLIGVLVALGRSVDEKDRWQVADVLFHQGRNDESEEVRGACRVALLELGEHLPVYLKDELMDIG